MNWKEVDPCPTRTTLRGHEDLSFYILQLIRLACQASPWFVSLSRAEIGSSAPHCLSSNTVSLSSAGK